MGELKSGIGYSDLSRDYVPKTMEEESIVEKRKQLTKDKLFELLLETASNALEENPGDSFLSELCDDLKKKAPKNFSLKSKLVELYSVVSKYIEDITAEKEFGDILLESDSLDYDENLEI